METLKPMIHGSTSFNLSWATNVERGYDLLNTHSTFVEQQLHILKMGDHEMLLSPYAVRVGVVQKNKTDRFKLEMAIKNRTSFGALTIHPALLVELRQNVNALIYRNFLCMDFTSLKELPQLETPVINRRVRRLTHEHNNNPKKGLP